MTNLYYKISLRIEEEGKAILYSDAYIIIKNEDFEGYLTCDYITGKITEKSLKIKYLSKRKCFDFYSITIKEEIFLPGEYFLKTNNSPPVTAEIKFIEKIDKFDKKQKINDFLEIIKKEFLI